jgi:hypothetical protein
MRELKGGNFKIREIISREIKFVRDIQYSVKACGVEFMKISPNGLSC